MCDAMIEPGTARQLVEVILRVEERLTRLLSSGWRQASTEAADLHHEADALSDAGLPALAARVSAVAAATDASSALHAIALASSACQLIRTRLLVSEPPDDWQPIRPPKSRNTRAKSTGDVLLPLARVQFSEREVWACGWLNRNQVVLLEPPLPASPTPLLQPAESGGLLSRMQQRLLRAIAPAEEAVPPLFWLHRKLRGTLRWQARHPVGAASEIAACTMLDAEWQPEEEHAERQQLTAFRTDLAANTVKEDYAPLNWTVNTLRFMRLDRADIASYVWLDSTVATAFSEIASPDAQALVLAADNIVVPLAVLRPGDTHRNARIVHLIPGLPADVLDAPASV